MTTIHLDDTVAAALGSQASALGLSLEDYLRRLAEFSLSQPPTKPLSGERLEQLLAEEANAGVVSPGTFTREEIYREHA
jgi:negative regulator of replication initiation